MSEEQAIVRVNDAVTLAGLNDQQLRVKAVKAAVHYDTDILILLVESYLTTAGRKGARTSRKTLDAYTLATRDFTLWAEQQGIELLRPGQRTAGRYIAHLQLRPNGSRGRQGTLAATTIAQYVAGVRALYRALRWAGAADLQPFIDAHPPTDPTPGITKNPPYLDEIDQVLPYCSPHLKALFLLCAHTGLRIGEALALTQADLSAQQVNVRGKGGKQRSVPLGRRVREALVNISSANTQGNLFEWNYAQATYRMRVAFKKAGLESSWRGFHAARKHSGTRLYEATKDFTRVGLFLGHASVDTTRRYVKVMDHDVSKELEDL